MYSCLNKECNLYNKEVIPYKKETELKDSYGNNVFKTLCPECKSPVEIDTVNAPLPITGEKRYWKGAKNGLKGSHY